MPERKELFATRAGPSEGVPKVFVGFVHPGHVVTTFAACIWRLLLAGRFQVIVVPNFAGPNIAQSRNDLAEAFLTTDCEYMLSVDTDIEFEVNDVAKLIEDDKPIVGGHYLNKYLDQEEPCPVGTVAKEGARALRATYENLGTSEGLVQVQGLGMGFTLIKREVMEALGTGTLWPFAEIALLGEQLGATGMKGDELDRVHLMSEDITFCRRAFAKYGYTSWLDLDCRVGHHKTTVYK